MFAARRLLDNRTRTCYRGLHSRKNLVHRQLQRKQCRRRSIRIHPHAIECVTQFRVKRQQRSHRLGHLLPRS